jgi:hypothetical protein
MVVRCALWQLLSFFLAAGLILGARPAAACTPSECMAMPGCVIGHCQCCCGAGGCKLPGQSNKSSRSNVPSDCAGVVGNQHAVISAAQGGGSIEFFSLHSQPALQIAVPALEISLADPPPLILPAPTLLHLCCALTV